MGRNNAILRAKKRAIHLYWLTVHNIKSCGGDFAGKLHLLMDYTDHPGDVADPWYTDDFETTWRDVLEGCQGLLEQLRSREGK